MGFDTEDISILQGLTIATGSSTVAINNLTAAVDSASALAEAASAEANAATTLAASVLAAAQTGTPPIYTISLGTVLNKTSVLKIGSTQTYSPVATTILTYTVPTGSTFYLQSIMAQVTDSASGTIDGSANIQIPSGTKVWSGLMMSNSVPTGINVVEEIPIPSGTVILMQAVPNSANSCTWSCNLIGYTKTPS